MTIAARPYSNDEHEGIDTDEHLAFGYFAPNTLQNVLIGLARKTVLHRGLFRRTMSRAVMGIGGGPLDVSFRGCAYRLRGHNNLIEFGILLNPRYNTADIDFLIEGVGPGSVFVDIGANVGLYTLPIAREVRPGGRVVAIDASGLMARRLAWNATASGLDNIAIFPCGVSDREGMGSLNIRKDDIAIVSLEEDVPGPVRIRSLPSILDEAGVSRIDALKIDIEGHEDRVLAPFIETRDAALLPARIVIEHPSADADYPACAAAFARRGYRLAGRSRNNSFYARG